MTAPLRYPNRSECVGALLEAGLDPTPPQTLSALTTTINPNRYLSHKATTMRPLENISDPVGRRLRELRLQARISAKKAAEAIGCSDALLLMYERGDSDILNAPYARLVAVARFYGVSISDITGAAAEMAAD